jgi:DNA-binding CsgD family transcriptional regulator/Tfp pilus assembly protein PilF
LPRRSRRAPRSDKRRLLHARLAEIAADPEERARHLAEAAEGPDLATARALAEPDRRAARRGAAADAARLLDRALALTPPGHASFARRVRLDAAQSHFESGNAFRARELLELAVTESASGPERAHAMTRLAAVLGETEGVEVATRLYRDALGEAGENPELLSEIEWGLAWNTCRLGSAPRAYEYAQAGYERVAEVAQPALKMASLAALAEFEFHLGIGSCSHRARQAVELEELHPDAIRPDFQPSMVLAWLQMRSGDLDSARPLLLRAHERTVEHGDEDARAKALSFLAQLECLAGNLELARRYAEEGHELALQTGQRILLATLLYCRGLVDAHLGRADSARATAQEGLELSEQVVHRWLVIRNSGVLGFLELSLDRPREALSHLERATRMLFAYGVREPGAYTGVADHAEALIALGELDSAAPLVDWLQERGEALGRSWALLAAARCRGLGYAAAGDGERAVAELERSLSVADGLAQPLERARTLLALGAVHRRQKRKRLARERLEAARAAFAAIGAELWRERTDAELARIGGRRAGSSELTPTERRVAELVADGLTNQEVAERAFLSVRSVESNLSKVYLKLGVRSRTELVRRLAGI